MIGLCDDQDRIAARIYVAVRYVVDKEARGPDPPHDCPCCAFWRGGLMMSIICAAFFAAFLLFR